MAKTMCANILRITAGNYGLTSSAIGDWIISVFSISSWDGKN